MKRWKLIALVSAIAALVLATLAATVALATPPRPPGEGVPPDDTTYYGGGMTGRYGRMMGGYGGTMNGYGGMMGQGTMSGAAMGPDMVGPALGYSNQAGPLSVDEARAAVEEYLAHLGNDDLAITEVMVFTNHAYAQVAEKSTGIGAFEVLVDSGTGAVYPEMGPNMMWNLKYGHMAGFSELGMAGCHGSGMDGWMMGGVPGGITPSEVSGEMPVSREQAVQAAQRYLDAYSPGAQAEDEVDPFYGYYTIHILKDGQTAGMLSVNGYTQQVLVHFWHGDLVDMAEYDHD